MAIQYTPGGDPSAVYYGTGTHASALLIGAALALAWPLRRLAAIPAAHASRLDMAGIAGLVVLAWATGHFSGSDPVVYPVGLLLAALAAAGLVAAAAGHGVIAALTSIRPLRWIGVRSYGIYLWHWPVIALGTALAGPDASSPWVWLVETGVTIALASASWRFIETPVMRNGLGVTVRHWVQLLGAASRRPAAGPARRAIPVTMAAAGAIIFMLACYGVARPPAAAAPGGLLRQVANGERVSSASRSTPAAPSPSSAPSAVGRAQATPTATPPPAACRPAQPRVSGSQVTAVGDSVLLASAAALEASLPGVYIDAKVDRQMPTGLTLVRSLAAAGRLRQVVVVSLGTNVRPAGLGARGQFGARRSGPAQQAHRTGRLARGHRGPSRAALAGRHPPAPGRRPPLRARRARRDQGRADGRPAGLVPADPDRAYPLAMSTNLE
jgi:hypothetical protein